MLPSSYSQEGKILDLDKGSIISDMTHITSKTIHPVDSDSPNSISTESSLSDKEPLSPNPKIHRPPKSSFSEDFNPIPSLTGK